MSYEDLTRRLVEDQEQVLGEEAIKAAEQVAGIQVSDGSVQQVDGIDAVEELVDQYEAIMGPAALTSLRIAAKDYDDELDLPAKLQL